MEHDLTAAAQGPPGGRDDNRHLRIPQPLRGLLERANHQVDLVPVALERFEQHEHEVCAGREIRRVVPDHQGGEIRRRLFHAGVEHLDRVAADCVHLRMELDDEHAVAHVHEACTRVPSHDLLAILGGLQDRDACPIAFPLRGRLFRAHFGAKAPRDRVGNAPWRLGIRRDGAVRSGIRKPAPRG